MPSISEQPSEQLILDYYSSMSRFWQPVSLINELENKLFETIVCGKSIVVARMGDAISAFGNTCRHFQAKLSLGEIDKTTDGEDILRYKYHGWAYNSDGKCIEIPQLPDRASIPPTAKITKYHVEARHGVLWVCLNDTPSFEIPGSDQLYPDMKSTAIQINNNWKTSVVRMILSALDDYHFPWLHQGMLGDRKNSLAPERAYETTDHQLITRFQSIQPANLTNSLDQDNNTSIVNYTMCVDIPNVLTLTKKNSDGGVYIVWFAAKAETFDCTPVFWRVVRNYGLDNDRGIIEMENFIQSQDIPVVNSQRPWLMKPLPLKEADGALMKYLKLLRQHKIPTEI